MYKKLIKQGLLPKTLLTEYTKEHVYNGMTYEKESDANQSTLTIR